MMEMSDADVCRLCLANENLVWIFAKPLENSENIKDIIYITTGVKIADTDIITQKVCKKCFQVVQEMFEFRKTSLKNDRHLREQCKRILRNEPIEIPNTNIIVKNFVKKTLSDKPVENEKKEVESELKPVNKIHPSVQKLFQEYPQIKLHNVCLSSHIAPVVYMELDAVETYFKMSKLDIVEHAKLALKSRRVTTKRTSASAQLKTLQLASSNSSPNTSRSENKDHRPPKPRIGPASKIAERSSHYSVTQPRITPDPSKVKTSERSKSGEKKVGEKTSLKAKSSRNSTPEKTPAVKKIKLSEDWKTPKKGEDWKTPKLNVIESLGLIPKSTLIESPNTLFYVANTSVPLHICNTCNSVQYTAKELRRHQVKHLRCQFCMLKCKNLEQKRLHIESHCVIIKTMNNLPNIYLDKIEFNLQVRQKYSKAFLDFPAVKGMYAVENRPSRMESSDGKADDKLIGLNDHEDIGFDSTEELPLAANTDHLRDNSDQNATSQENIFPPKDSTVKAMPSVDDIIELISDDEHEAPACNASANQSKLKKMLLADESVDSNSVLPPLVSIARPVPVTPAEENASYSTVSIVKPDIKIQGTTILDNMDLRTTDLRVLKELLTIYKPVQLLAEKQVQTELPSNRAIIVNRSELDTKLSCLKQQLYAYRIPVQVKNGSFNVSYSYQKEYKRQKKLSLWSDLTPIDLKSTHVNIPVSSSPNVNWPVSSSVNVNLPISRNANVSLPVSSSTNVNLLVSNKNLPISSTSNINLPSRSSGIRSLPVSSCANTVTSQNSSVQNVKNVYATTPSANSTLNNSVTQTANIVNMNPMVTNDLSVQNVSAPAVITAPIPPTSHIDTNNIFPVGRIRVKNVWELT